MSKRRDAETYIDCLIRTSELTERSFPETNIAVFKSQNLIGNRLECGLFVEVPAVNRLITSWRMKWQVLGFNLGDVDLSGMLDDGVVKQAYSTRNPDASEGRVRAQTGSVMNFIRDIRICDYVLMPDGDGQRIHYGKVVSDPYHAPNGPWENRRGC